MSNEALGAPPRVRYALLKMSVWDRAAIILLGAAGFLFSYDALRQVAIAIHARPSLSYLFPVFVDGFIAYGVRALVLLRHSGFGARLYAWILFLAATGSSLWANSLHAITLNRGPQPESVPLHLSNNVVGVLSTLAPLALAGSVHLYIIMARTAESSVPDRPESRPGPVPDHVPVTRAPAITSHAQQSEAHDGQGQRHPSAAGPPTVQHGHPYSADGYDTDLVNAETPARTHPGDADNPLTAGREHAEHPPSDEEEVAVPDEDPMPGQEWESSDSAAPEPPAQEASASGTNEGEPPVLDGGEGPDDREIVDEWLVSLLPVAREASRQAGRISRDAIKEAVRALQPISNDRLGELVSMLRKEEEAADAAPVDSPKPLW